MKIDTNKVSIQLLGQSGCIFYFPQTTIYIDPYLSNSVKELDSHDLDRNIPIPISPETIQDADYVLITHEHIDHCDPHTLPILSKASPQAQFIAPKPVMHILQSWDITNNRCILAQEDWLILSSEIKLKAVPAAHPEIERDADNNLRYVGYLLEYQGKHIYLAGDTSVCGELINTLKAFQQIDIAFLPVNEKNYFREQRGIIGNMSIREAFQLAEEVNIKQVVPVHWDMFAANSVTLEEINAVYTAMNPKFKLLIKPQKIEL
ncbi:MAG: MBL fold metallo-hydrolase [Thiotrichaceae bacterium]|nr:MBL fold metallo-hydrolase [Thiotrichaceae bacterium]